MNQLLKLLLISLLLVIVGCDKKKGKSIGAPKIEPPVKNNTPSGLATTSLNLFCPDCPEPLTVIKSRLFSPGPTNFQNRLNKIDERMASLNSRSEESERKCLDSSPTEWNPGTLPNGDTFLMYFNCHEQLNEYSQLAFGFKDDNFYLAELQQGGGEGPPIAVLAKANKAGTLVEFWQIQTGETVATEFSYQHVKADDATSSLEVSAGGDMSGMGVSCGIQMKSNASYVYSSGIFADSQSQGGNVDCDATDANYPQTSVCATASDLTLESDDTNCTAANLATFDFGKLERNALMAADGQTNAAAIINAVISGIGNFND